jgi:hypothetical protein
MTRVPIEAGTNIAKAVKGTDISTDDFAINVLGRAHHSKIAVAILIKDRVIANAKPRLATAAAVEAPILLLG